MASTQTKVLTASEVADVAEAAEAADARAKTKSRARRAHTYGALGQGSTWQISLATTLVLLALWWLATRLGWIKPLFLPSPKATFDAFIGAVKGNTQGDTPLLQHVSISVFRVLAAFALAVVTAVPVGIAMGTSRLARG